jgi:hypothetical protein
LVCGKLVNGAAKKFKKPERTHMEKQRKTSAELEEILKARMGAFV